MEQPNFSKVVSKDLIPSYYESVSEASLSRFQYIYMYLLRYVLFSEFQISEETPFDANPLVIVIALLGWTIPASLPSNIPLFHGTGLTQAFFTSIQYNLAQWPKGPALDDPFWVRV